MLNSTVVTRFKESYWSVTMSPEKRTSSTMFTTIDSNLGQIENLRFLEALGANVIGIDLFGEGATDRIADLLARHPKPLLLFCDNGNKREEVRRFAPLLSGGDFLAVHDWGSEFFESDVPSNLEMVWPDPPEASGLTRWFCVRTSANTDP